jgi:membrane-associated phospholipid phosphatase
MTNITRLVALALGSVLSVPTLVAQTNAPQAQIDPAPESPELKTFGIQLLRNLEATFTSKQNILPLAVDAGATAVSSIWDDNLQRHFAEPDKGTVVSDIGTWLGSRGLIGGVAGGLLLIGYTSENHKLRRVGYDLVQPFILVEGLTVALKHTVRRERPNGEDRQSFVSGHSSQSFAVAVVAVTCPQ